MPTRRTVLGALAGAAVGVACGGVPRTRPGDTLNALAERYVRLTLKLAQHQPDLVETYLGPADWRPGPRVPVAGLLDEVVALDTALTQLMLDDSTLRDRAQYLRGQTRGLRMAARRLSGETMRFADEARDVFGIGWPAEPSEAVAAARTELDTRLAGKGPLPARYAAFRQRHALAGDRVLPVFRAAVAACRARVAPHLPLPDGERLAIEPLAGGGFEARAIYDGEYLTRVALSTSGPTDLVRLVWLAAHEAYPGHHVQHVLADRDLVRGRGWIERTLLPAFGPHVFAAEGAAEAGAALLFDRQTLTDVVASLAREAQMSPDTAADLAAVHAAVTALDEFVPRIAQAYLDGEIGSEAAKDRLRDEALVPDAPQLLGLIERQRTRILAYPAGRRFVSRVVFAQPAERRWIRLGGIATTMIANDGRRS